MKMWQQQIQDYNPFNEQEEKDQAVKDEIIMLQIKIDKAKNRMAHILEEGGML